MFNMKANLHNHRAKKNAFLYSLIYSCEKSQVSFRVCNYNRVFKFWRAEKVGREKSDSQSKDFFLIRTKTHLLIKIRNPTKLKQETDWKSTTREEKKRN